MEKVELKFPIFVFGDQNDNMIYVYFEDKKYKSTCTQLLNEGVFDDTEVIDSLGTIYRIIRAYKVANRGLFGYIPLERGGKQILIDFEYENRVDTISLDDLKVRIIPMVENMKDIWEESYGDIEELKQLIMNSKSFEEIARLLI